MFEEHASGGRWDRPQLHLMLDFLQEGDCVVAWMLDQLSRSLRDLLQIMDKITDRGAGFRSLTEAIDTTAPAGRMLMQTLGSFAEFEREMIRERTRIGMAAARARGRQMEAFGWHIPRRHKQKGPLCADLVGKVFNLTSSQAEPPGGRAEGGLWRWQETAHTPIS